MKVFKDTSGVEWSIDVNHQSRLEVQAATGVDLYAWRDGSLLGRLGDPETTVDVLHCLCREQAEKRDVGPAAFAKALARTDVYRAAVAAMVAEMGQCEPPAEARFLTKMLADLEDAHGQW